MSAWRRHVEGAYNPSDRGSSAGGDHLVLDEPLRFGRLVREAGDPLCKPAKKFCGLTGPVDRQVTCHHCIRQAFRLGWDFEAMPQLDLGRIWSARLVIEKGRPERVEFRNRWFGSPPPIPPTPPTPERLLSAVRTLVPSVEHVSVNGWIDGSDVGGTATIE